MDTLVDEILAQRPATFDATRVAFEQLTILLQQRGVKVHQMVTFDEHPRRKHTRQHHFYVPGMGRRIQDDVSTPLNKVVLFLTYN